MRKIIRNILKRQQGNNKIQRAWRKFQDKRYRVNTKKVFTKIGKGEFISGQTISNFNKKLIESWR